MDKRYRNIVFDMMFRGGSRTAATSKMEHFVIINNGWKPLTITTKSSILDVAAILDPPLILGTCLEKRISENMYESVYIETMMTYLYFFETNHFRCWTGVVITTRYFCKQRIFSVQPQCCLTSNELNLRFCLSSTYYIQI